MRDQPTDGLISAMLVLAAAAAVLSLPPDPAAHFLRVGSLLLATSVPDEAIAAGALGDVRDLDVAP